MEIAFLGTGSAFSTQRHCSAVLINGTILLDAGAPLLHQLGKLGRRPQDVELVLISHYHGDHLFGLPAFLLHRLVGKSEGQPCTVVGPSPAHPTIQQWANLSWQNLGPLVSETVQVTTIKAGEKIEAAGVQIEAVGVVHADLIAVGYRLTIDQITLAYSGDCILGPGLDRLLDGADIAIVEATGPDPDPVHLSWSQVRSLVEQHPGTRFFLTHIHSGVPDVAGATAAHDLDIFTL